MYLLFTSWKSGEHSHYPLPTWAKLQATLTELGLSKSTLPEGHSFKTGYFMESDSTWYSWTEVNPRDVFMDLYRDSETLNDYMSADDCSEVFSGILKGGSDISVELFNDIAAAYNVDLHMVDSAIADKALNESERYHNRGWYQCVQYRVELHNGFIHLYKGKEKTVLVGRGYKESDGSLHEQAISMAKSYVSGSTSL